MKKVCTMVLMLFLASAVYSAQEPIRCGYGSGIAKESFFKKLSDAGFNYYIWKMGASPVTGGKLSWEDGKLKVVPNQNVINKIKLAAKNAQKHGIKLLLSASFNKKALNALKSLGPYDKAVVEGPRSYLSRGVNNAPWPGDKKLWNGIMLEDAVIIAKLAKENPGISGFLFDLEMYGGKINWWYCTSFDEKSLEAFRKANPEIEVPELAIGKRYNWLKKHKLLKKYYACLSQISYSQAKRIGEAVKTVNPELQLGMYAFGRDWFHPWFAKGLAEGMERPVWIFSEDEYNNGFSSAVYATIRFVDKMNFPYRYIPGLHIVKHMPKGLEENISLMLKECNGYWLFTMANLSVPVKKLPKSYQPPEGTTQAEYWESLKKVNQESDHKGFKVEKTVTPNIYTKAEPQKVKGLRCILAPKPASLAGIEPNADMLFDGNDLLPGVIAWELKKNLSEPKAVATIILPRTIQLDKVALAVPTILLRNFRIPKDFDVEVQARVKGKWTVLGSYNSVELRKVHKFFNLVCKPEQKTNTKMIKIVFRVKEPKASLIKTLKKYQALFIILAEVAIWEK